MAQLFWWVDRSGRLPWVSEADLGMALLAFGDFGLVTGVWTVVAVPLARHFKSASQIDEEILFFPSPFYKVNLSHLKWFRPGLF